MYNPGRPTNAERQIAAEHEQTVKEWRDGELVPFPDDGFSTDSIGVNSPECGMILA